MSTLLIKNVELYNQKEPVDILIQDEHIARIAAAIEETADQVIDATGKTAIPGVIDVHVHFRVPGGEHKEDWQTGSQAALHGGVTTVFDMPNNTPSITTAELLQKKIEQITPVAGIDFGCYIGATNDNIDELREAAKTACGVKVYYGETTGDIVMNDPAVLKKVFELNLPIPIVIHAEDNQIIQKNMEQYKEEGYHEYDVHGRIRDRSAAITALETILPLLHGTHAKVHITHMSTKEELELVRQAKSEKLNVTCDVTPHHLGFSIEDMKEKGWWLKMNPPLREQEDIQALWDGVISGDIDMIATDHAPHTRQEKGHADYWQVPSGVPGIETSLLFMLEARSEELPLERIVELMSVNPAQRFGLSHKGVIEEGAQADIVLLNLDTNTTLRVEDLQSKSQWSPWEGKEFSASIEQVIRRGKPQYEYHLTE